MLITGWPDCCHMLFTMHAMFPHAHHWLAWPLPQAFACIHISLGHVCTCPWPVGLTIAACFHYMHYILCLHLVGLSIATCWAMPITGWLDHCFSCMHLYVSCLYMSLLAVHSSTCPSLATWPLPYVLPICIVHVYAIAGRFDCCHMLQLYTLVHAMFYMPNAGLTIPLLAVLTVSILYTLVHAMFVHVQCWLIITCSSCVY